MRKILISLMAAGMLVPVAAQAQDRGIERVARNHAERSSRAESRSDDRSSRSQSSHRSERSDSDRSERAGREDRAPRIERTGGDDNGIHRVEGSRRGNDDIPQMERIRRGDRDGQQAYPVPVTESVRRTERSDRNRDGLVGTIDRIARDGDNDRDWRRDREGRRDGDRDWRRDRDGRHDWSRDWRKDRRYDWSSHRNRYRSLFRLGRYYDPYGWGYRRFSIGFSLWPSYYGSSFWLDDPWRYRLPPAYGPYRWIRYYDDALLVNIYTGQVVDVIHNVFW